MGYGWPALGGIGNIDYTTASGLSLGTTINWGGAIVSLLKGGVEYIDRNDAGRDLQSAMWYQDVPPYPTNPTEAGDTNNNGSPVINYDLGWPFANQLHTRTLALQWGNDGNRRIGLDYPILTGTEIEKWLTIENSNRIRSMFNSDLQRAGIPLASLMRQCSKC